MAVVSLIKSTNDDLKKDYMLSKLYPQVMWSFIHDKTCLSQIGSSHSLKCFLKKTLHEFLAEK